VNPIFHTPPALQPHVRKLMDAAFAEVGPAFRNRAEMEAFFRYVFTPRSNRWAFLSSGKTGTTSAIGMLFELEFGVPLTAAAGSLTDMNRDGAVHHTIEAGVFRALHQRADIDCMTTYLRSTLRIATVRHPTDRAWSAFRYLCRSQDLAHPQFAHDRIRLCATTGFDWTRHARSRDGFLLFLDYVALALSETGGMPVNNHWRPQVMDIRPDLFPPDILGRMEDPAAFAAALQARLEPSVRLAPRALNRSDDSDRPDWLSERAVRARLEQVYAADYEAFRYDP
jgi:hypothetical protein